MKFGVNTFLWSLEFGPAQFSLLPVIRKQGFDGIEVPLFHPENFAAREIRRALEAEGLACTICSVLPRPFSLISEEPGVRQQTRSHLADCVAAAAEVNASVMAGPLYAPVGYLPGRRRTTDEWAWVVEAYQELGPALNAHNVQIALEPLNRFETFFLNTTSDAVQLCEEIGHSSVGILWDTFHANIEEKNPPKALLSTGKHLKHVHTCENDRGTPGTGHVDWPGVFNALSQIGYGGWLTIESFGFALGELSAAASIWRDLAASPEEISREGVRFLRAQMAASASSPKA